MNQNTQTQNRNSSKVPKYLPENRMSALRGLHINPTHKKNVDESPAFLLYLNYAVNTICDITKIDQQTSKPSAARTQVKEKGKDVIRKLANFFWLFNVDDPERDFPKYEEQTLDIVEKIYDLRNYFAHLEQNGVQPLVLNRNMFVFIEGLLGPLAIQNTLKPGMKTAKLFKMSLAAVRDKSLQTYEFTRKGLIFFICLSLYRDDAIEFTQCLEDMKLPNCPKGKSTIDDCLFVCKEECTSKPAAAKALIETFTFFSARRGRSVSMLEKNLDYLSFADISGYLNKVPAESMEYLVLQDENEKLQTLCLASEESPENKEFKYKLHKRFRNRFLSIATGYCEDLGILPSLKFKRLDISNKEGRKKYFFGTEHDNRAHMDRHYHIEKDAVRFAWEPKKHYGPIHVDSLRSAMSSSTMKEILFAHFNGEKTDAKINEYFSAYHRVLETILNTLDPNDLYVEEGNPILKDFSTVSGISESELLQDLSPLYRFFPQNLIRFFTGDENRPGDSELKEPLIQKLGTMWDHAADFQNRLNKLEEWKKNLGELRKKDPEAKLSKPICTTKDVVHPPRNCDISDAALIAWVFRFFNLFLSNEKKFRQLPIGEQHRGVLDHEYQLVHALIGKYALDPKGLSNYITNRKTELLPALDILNSYVAEAMKAKKNAEKAKRGEQKKRPVLPTLSMLASAAVSGYIDHCEEKINFLENADSIRAEILRKECRKFGIRTGMPLDRTALLKTVLHLDLAKWTNAYDYQNRKPYENRSLDANGHVVSQVPFPADFAQSIMLASRKENVQAFKTRKDEKDYFDFNAAFRAFNPQITARNFYNTAPMISASVALKKNLPIKAIKGLKTMPDEGAFPADFLPNVLAKAIRTIKDTQNQDKILLEIAAAYWKRFQTLGTFLCTKGKNGFPEKPSIYDYFDADILIDFPKETERKIQISPNDANRPILSQIIAYAPDIAAVMNPEHKQKVFAFYEMLKTYRILQAKDRAKRLEIILLINRFAESVMIPPENYKGKTKEEIRSMEFEIYRKRFRKLTEDEYELLANSRNAVFHRGINLNIAESVEILKKYVGNSTQATCQKSTSDKTENHSFFRLP